MNEDIIIGTHNTMSYLPIECKWYLKPFMWIGNKLFAQCQNKNIEQQIFMSGARVFDLRVYRSPRGWNFAHGIINYQYDYNLIRILNILSNYNFPIYVRIILERCECEWEVYNFQKLCKMIENNDKYKNITFFGGNRKGDWKKLYQFKNEEFTDDNNNQWVSSMAEDVRWYEKVCPRLYAMRMNELNRKKAKYLTNLYDFV